MKRAPFAVVHGKCQNKDKCTGPGCKLRTGKTREAHAKGKGKVKRENTRTA